MPSWWGTAALNPIPSHATARWPKAIVRRARVSGTHHGDDGPHALGGPGGACGADVQARVFPTDEVSLSNVASPPSDHSFEVGSRL